MIKVPDWRDQSGQILVMLPFVLIVIFAIAAGVIDLGNGYLTQARLQSALDAGSLAATQDLARGKDSQTALADANSMIHHDGFPNLTLTPSEIQMNPSYQNAANGVQKTSNIWVRLTAKVLAPTYFFRLFGKANIPVAATSKAASGVVTGGNGMVPIGVPATEFSKFSSGQQVPLSNISGSGPGIYDFLSFPDGNGAKILQNDIEKGYSGTLSIGDQVDVQPGKDTGPVADAVQYRMSQPAPEICSSYKTADWTCPQMLFLPVIDYTDANGRSKKVPIVGFAAFYLEPMQGKGGSQQIVGEFVQMLRPGDISKIQHTSYGTTTVKLVMH